MLQCPLVDLVDLFWFCPPISWVILPIELCHLELSRCLLMHSHLLEGTPWTHHHRLLSYWWVPNMTFDQYLLGFHLDPQWFPYCFSCVSIISLANVVSKIIKTYRHRLDSLSLNLLYHFKWKSRPVLTAVLFTGWCSSVMSCVGSSSIVRKRLYRILIRYRILLTGNAIPGNPPCRLWWVGLLSLQDNVPPEL